MMGERVLPSDKARNDIEVSVRAAMATIRAEIDRRYDAKIGFHSYEPNNGRISTAEVLRRAGGVDKNTLKETYHSDLRKDVLAFVKAQQLRLIAHERSEARKRAKEAKSDSELVNWYAQQAKAADFRADVAERQAKELRTQLATSEEGRVAALKQIETLQIELSEGRVVRLHPTP